MIKVLHLISGGDNGGAKTHIFNLMKGLEGKVDAKIICFTKTEFYDEAVERGIDIEVFYQEKRSDLSVVSKIRDLDPVVKRTNMEIKIVRAERIFIYLFSFFKKLATIRGTVKR